MVVKAKCVNGRVHTMYKDIDSFKVTYDQNDIIHIKSSGNRFSITSNLPFNEEKYGLVNEYNIEYSDDKHISITQPAKDIWEFSEA